MAKLSNIVEIVINAKDNASSSFGKIGTNMQSFAKNIQGMSTVAFGSFSLGLGLALKSASDLEETTQKFGVTFSNVIGKANLLSTELAEGFGFAEEESKNLLSATGDLLTGFGFTQSKALGLSNEVQKLASDLASFNNLEGGATQASKALTAGLLGEREQLKSLGIVIREQDVTQRLLTEGKSKLTGMSLLQAKAEITLKLAMEQSKNAIGDFARSQDSLANQTKIMSADLKDLVAEFGKGFIPVAKEAIKAITPIIKGVSKWIGENKELTKGLVIVSGIILGLGIILSPILVSLSALISLLGGIAVAIRVVTAAMLANPIIAIIAGIVALVSAIVIFREEIGGFLQSIWDFATGLGEKFGILGKIVSGLIKVTLAPLLYLIKGIIAAFDLLFGKKKIEIEQTANITQSGINTASGNLANTSGKTEVKIDMGGVTVNNEADEDRLVEKIKNSFIREKQLSNNGIIA